MGSKIIGAIEIGTSKITVLVGEVINQKGLTIIGVGTAPVQGVVKGEIVDFDRVSVATHTVIRAAEKQAGVEIQEVYLAQSGAHIQGFFQRATVSVESEGNYVTPESVQRVKQSAKTRKLSADRAYVHHILAPFKLDGKIVKNPIGLSGKTLEVGYWSVLGEAVKVRDPMHIINAYGLSVTELVLSSLASAKIVTQPHERESGVLVLDIGRGVTDYALYQNGSALRVGVIPVGGDHLTNDLSIGLRLSVKGAERLKIHSGTVNIQGVDKKEKVMLKGDLTIGDRFVSHLAIAQILHLRVKELFQIAKEEIAEVLGSGTLPSGVILTGGTSKLHGMDQLAGEVFEMPCYLGKSPGWVREELKAPEYSTVLGTLYYSLDYYDEQKTVVPVPPKKSFWNNLFGRT